MTRRLLRWLIVLLFLAPVLALTAAGGWLLWERGWLLWLVWGLLICWGISAVLWRFVGLWSRPRLLPVAHLTERDEAAQRIIGEHTQRVESILKDRPDELLKAETYTSGAVELARDLDRHYHPDAKAPFESLSLLEIVSVAELAIHDVARLVEDTVLGSHLLTLGQVRRLAGLSRAYQKASTAWSIASALWSIPRAAINYLLSKVGGGFVFSRVRENVLGYLYVLFLQRIGHYLIEVYSGRLRGGAVAYLRLTRSEADLTAFGDRAGKPSPEEGDLKIAVVGQVKAGKSSVVNAILGEAKAEADVLPATRSIIGYRLKAKEGSDALVLLDTLGYSEGGPKRDELEAVVEAAQGAAMILVVLHATNPAREPDLKLLRQLDEGFQQHPHLKRPPLLGVLTHIDQLKPVLEWEPPYAGWLDEAPSRAKERAIRKAVEYAGESLSPFLGAGVVPACTDPNRLYGVSEWLLPAISSLLPAARAKRLVDLLHAAGDRRGLSFGTFWETARQLAEVGLGALGLAKSKGKDAPRGPGES